MFFIYSKINVSKQSRFEIDIALAVTITVKHDVGCNVMQAWEMYISGNNNYVRCRMQCDAGLGNVH